MRIGFIGAGKVGCSLAQYFYIHNCSIEGFFSNTPAHAQEIAKKTDSKVFSDINETALNSDLLFLTVPDSKLTAVFNEINKDNLKNTIVCHCSGSLTANEVFGNNGEEINLKKVSLHPLCAVDSKDSYRDFEKVFFFLEGDTAAADTLKDFLSSLGLKVKCIKPEVKTRYHLAASVVSNQVVGLINEGIKLLEQCGFNREDSLSALSPLISGNIEHIIKNGPQKALTGPVQRGDAITVEKHLGQLHNENDRILYKLISLKLLEIAKEKSPQKDFKQLENVLSI